MADILLFETDQSLADSLSTALQSVGHNVTLARSTADHSKTKCAAMVLGFVPPEKISVLTGVPIIALGDNAAADASERLAAPVRMGLLLERLDYFLRVKQQPATIIQFCGYQLEPTQKKLSRSQNATTSAAPPMVIELTEKEVAIFVALAAAPESFLARDQLLAAVWGYNERIDTHTLETHIYRLRRKLEDAGERADLLLSDAGGYRLNG
jgi:DNA-binding response OmpR family regulator